MTPLRCKVGKMSDSWISTPKAKNQKTPPNRIMNWNYLWTFNFKGSSSSLSVCLEDTDFRYILCYSSLLYIQESIRIPQPQPFLQVFNLSLPVWASGASSAWSREDTVFCRSSALWFTVRRQPGCKFYIKLLSSTSLMAPLACNDNTTFTPRSDGLECGSLPCSRACDFGAGGNAHIWLSAIEKWGISPHKVQKSSYWKCSSAHWGGENNLVHAVRSWRAQRRVCHFCIFIEKCRPDWSDSHVAQSATQLAATATITGIRWCLMNASASPDSSDLPVFLCCLPHFLPHCASPFFLPSPPPALIP